MANTEIILDPRRNQAADRKKLYEEMLLKEMPGTSQPNEAMHAVLEGELGECEMVEGREAQNVRNHALIHYLATLATSNSTKDTFDFDFVESLLTNGADINSTDKTGQTIFHEIARSWNIDVAKFLITKGAHVNQQDQYGRSPLHVAAAVDYAEMVEFLLQNEADIDIKTAEEGQAPIHFAAKNDAINSLQMLLGYGANIDARDTKNRTPLQVAAEMNRSKAAKHLIAEGAPAGVYDNLGNSALCLLIEKIPEVALKAMDQFHSVDTINRKEFYFLNYLEGTKLKEEKTPARTPLEIAVQNERFDIVMHPVMQRLIAVKWKMYGKWGAVLDLVLNLLYTILWTVLAVSLPKDAGDLYFPLEKHVWRFLIGIGIVVFTIVEIRKQITNTIKSGRSLKKWKEWRAAELARDIAYCHPRWPQETQYLKSEIKAVGNLSLVSGTDWWLHFDRIALLFILATFASHATFFYKNTDLSKEVHHYMLIPLLLILWLRIFKYARPFEGAGPFVVIFGHVMGDVVKWGFLNLVIVIPFTCAFWITFGAISLTPVDGYDRVGPLLYNIFSMMVVNDHGYENLEAANPIMARLLCGSFIAIAAIVTLNLLIALLSNTFERLYENAVANAVMQRARTILLLQKSLRKKQKKKYYGFIKKKGSPEVIRNDLGRLFSTDGDENASIEQVQEDVRFIMKILGERFGKKFGKGKKSDMDFVKMDLSKVRRFQEELVVDIRNMKLMIQGIPETMETLRAKINTSQDTNVVNNGDNNGENKNNDNSNNGSANNTKTKVSSPTSKAFPINTIPYLMRINKKEQRLQKKAKKSEDDSDSESSSSQDSSDDNDRKSKRNKKHNKNKKKNNQKDRRDTDSDEDKREKKTKRLPYPGSETTNPMLDFNNNAYPPRLTTSASYYDFRPVHDQIPLLSQGYPASRPSSPYPSSNIHISNSIPTTPYDSPVLGEGARRFALQNAQRTNGFTNYGFHLDNQEVANQFPMTPPTNIQYHPNISSTLHVPNATLQRSVSESRYTYNVPSIHQNPQPHQSEMPHVTVLQPQHEAEPSHSQPSWVQSPTLNERSHDLSFPIPRASMPSDQQSYTAISDLSHGQANPTIYSPDNTSET